MSTKKQTTQRKKTQVSNHSASAPRRRQSKKARKKQQKLYLFLGLGIGLCACLLIFSIYKLSSIFLGYQSGSKEYTELQQYVTAEAPPPDETPADEEDSGARVSRIDLASLKEINSEAVGWVEIPDTEISYPMAHTSDNSYYLTHTFSNEKNKAGSIFIETANKSDFSDLHTIIYGHNMKNGSMFAGLKNFSKKDYWESHPYVYIDLEDGSHCYEIFSCHVAPVTDITYTIGFAPDDTYASFLEEITASSAYDTGVKVGVDDYVVSLSTCTNGGKDRFVVHAKKLY